MSTFLGNEDGSARWSWSEGVCKFHRRMYLFTAALSIRSPVRSLGTLYTIAMENDQIDLSWTLQFNRLYRAMVARAMSNPSSSDEEASSDEGGFMVPGAVRTVSYTHLTLPTILLV